MPYTYRERVTYLAPIPCEVDPQGLVALGDPGVIKCDICDVEATPHYVTLVRLRCDFLYPLVLFHKHPEQHPRYSR